MPDLRKSLSFQKMAVSGRQDSLPCRPRNELSTRSVVPVVGVSEGIALLRSHT